MNSKIVVSWKSVNSKKGDEVSFSGRVPAFSAGGARRSVRFKVSPKVQRCGFQLLCTIAHSAKTPIMEYCRFLGQMCAIGLRLELRRSFAKVQVFADY